MDAVLGALKAAGEPTRLRILLMLHRSELTVSEICRILGQSQPRVSRHLKLLCDAGLLVRQAEGTSAYYRHAPEPFAEQFLASVRELTDLEHSTVARDQQELTRVRADRAEVAARSLMKVSLETSALEGRKAPVDEVERAMVAAVDGPVGTLLDVGTGTGRVFELFAPRTERGIGIELSREMLNLARSRLDAADLGHFALRSGNAYALDIDPESDDLAVLHHLLHFLDEPARAVEQAAAALAPGGRLLVVDFAAHKLEELRTDHGHRRLGFTDDEVTGWCRSAGLTVTTITHLDPPPADVGDDDLLTVTIWVGHRAPPSPNPFHALTAYPNQNTTPRTS